MDIDVIRIVVILIIAGLCWYANARLNKVPVLNEVVSVLIVVLSVLLLLSACGLTQGLHHHITI